MSTSKYIPKAAWFRTEAQLGNRNIGLDFIRAACLLIVVFAHTNNYMGSFTGIYRLIFPIVFLCQELFFALSGFLVGKKIIDGINIPGSFSNLLQFYKNRWLRTVPVYLIFLLINLSLWHLLYKHSAILFIKEVQFNPWEYVFFCQNIFTQHPYFFPEVWTLPIQEWSFILIPIPIVVLASVFKKPLSLTQIIYLLLFAIILVNGIRIHYVVQNNPEIDWGLRKIVAYRMDALLYGFLLRVLMVKFPEFFRKKALTLMLGGLLLSFFIAYGKTYIPEITYKSVFFVALPIGMSATIPFFYQFDFSFITKRLQSLLTHISLISYSVLLSHLYFIQFGLLYFYQPLNGMQGLAFTLIYLMIIFVVSTFFFNFVERPLILRFGRAKTN